MQQLLCITSNLEIWRVNTVTPASSVRAVALVGNYGFGRSLAYHKGKVYFATQNILYTSDLQTTTPIRIGRLPTGIENADGLTSYKGDLLLAAFTNDGAGLWKLDLDDPAGNSVKQGDFPTGFNPAALAYSNDNLYALNGGTVGELWNVNVDTPSSSSLIKSLLTDLQAPNGLAEHDGVLYATSSNILDNIYELWRVDTTPSGRSVKVGRFPTGLTIPAGLTSRFIGTDLLSDGNELSQITPRYDKIYSANAGNSTFWRVDRNTPSESVELGTLGGGITSLVAMSYHNGELLAIAGNGRELWSLDPDDVSAANKIGDLPSGLAHGLGLASYNGELLAVDNSGDELWLIDRNNPSASTEVGDFPNGLDNPRSLAAIGDRLFTCDNDGDELWEVDRNTPSASIKIGDLPAGFTGPDSLTNYNGELICVNNDADQLWKIDIETPTNSALIGRLPSGLGSARGLATVPFALPLIVLPSIELSATVSIDGLTANATAKISRLVSLSTTETLSSPTFTGTLSATSTVSLTKSQRMGSNITATATLSATRRLSTSPSLPVLSASASLSVIPKPATLLLLSAVGQISDEVSLGAVLDDDFLYCVDNADDALWKVFPSNPTASQLVGMFPDGLNTPLGLAFHNESLYAVDNAGDELWRINTVDPMLSTEVGEFPALLSAPSGLTSHNGELLVVDKADDSLWLVDVDTPSASVKIGDLPALVAQPDGLASHGGSLYAVDNAGDELWLINRNNPTTSTQVGFLPVALNTPTGLTSRKGVLYCANRSTSTLWRVNTANPRQSVEVGDFPDDLASPSGLASSPIFTIFTATVSLPALDASASISDTKSLSANVALSSLSATAYIGAVKTVELTANENLAELIGGRIRYKRIAKLGATATLPSPTFTAGVVGNVNLRATAVLTTLAINADLIARNPNIFLTARTDLRDVIPSARLAEFQPDYPGLTLLVDWSGDGDFSHASSDVSEFIVPSSFDCHRGRNFSAQAKATAAAGKLNVKLWSEDNRFDLLASDSIISGVLPQGKKITARIGIEEIWSGHIDEFNFKLNYNGFNTVEITGLGNIANLVDEKVNIAPHSRITTAEAAELVLSRTGETAYIAEGDVVLDRWRVEETDTLSALRDLEELELGFLCERRDGAIWFQGRSLREGGIYQTPAMELRDDTGIIVAERFTEIKRIANTVSVPVNSFADGSTEVLWTTANPITVPANDTLQIKVAYPTPNAPTEHIGIAEWQDPIARTDYTPVSGLDVSADREGEALLVNLANTTSRQLDITALQARGSPLIAEPPYDLERDDVDSVAAYGKRAYPSASKLHTNLATALSYADTLLSLNAPLKPVYRVKWDALTDWRSAATLDLSRRITLQIDRERIDCFIEAIEHKISAANRHEVIYLLTQVVGETRPYSPLAPTLRGNTYTSMDVIWNRPFSGGSAITGYDLEYREIGDIEWIDAEHSGITPSITLLDLNYNATYEVRVRAVNALGHSVFSGIAVGQTLRVKTPQKLTATDIRGNGFRMHWERVIPAAYITAQFKEVGADEWQFLRDRNSRSYKGAIREMRSLDQVLSIGQPDVGTTYEWRLQAADMVGDTTYVSEWSSPHFVTLAESRWLPTFNRNFVYGYVGVYRNKLTSLVDSNIQNRELLTVLSTEDGSVVDVYDIEERWEWNSVTNSGTTWWGYTRLAQDGDTSSPSYPFVGSRYDPRIIAYSLSTGNRDQNREPDIAATDDPIPDGIGFYQNRIYALGSSNRERKLFAFSAIDGRRLASYDSLIPDIYSASVQDISISEDGVISLFGGFRHERGGDYYNRVAFIINAPNLGWRHSYDLALTNTPYSGASDGDNIYVYGREPEHFVWGTGFRDVSIRRYYE